MTFGDFRNRVTRHQTMMGTFIKSPGPHGIEIIAGAGIDFVVVDAEHAPFDKGAIDIAVLSANAAGITALVRVDGVHGILNALDCGATGVMVPHIDSAAAARDAAHASRYRPGRRGFSSSGRCGAYGRLKFSEHMTANDARTTVIAMLEDAQAVDNIDEIVGVPGIDAYFLGRGDLTAALGASSSSEPLVVDAVAKLARAVTSSGKTLWAYVNNASEAKDLAGIGVTGFIVGSDQGFMRRAAQAEYTAFRAVFPPVSIG
jgi:2-keto-3-deoxy-L-rhamnonate aldolase RhmA